MTRSSDTDGYNRSKAFEAIRNLSNTRLGDSYTCKHDQNRPISVEDYSIITPPLPVVTSIAFSSVWL